MKHTATATPINPNTKRVKVTEVTKTNQLTDEALNGLTSVDDALKALGATSPDDLAWDSSPWAVIDKDKLVGRAFLAVQWKFQTSKDYLGSQYVSVYVITQDSLNGQTNFVLNDGSTGIFRQLRELTDARLKAGHKNPQAGALVKGGLKLSEYDRTDDNGEIIGKGKTYYLSN